MKKYIPQYREEVTTVVPGSAWLDIPTILSDIIKRFNIQTNTALEFGCDMGYSASALSKYFDNVITVDSFRGDLLIFTEDQSKDMYKRVAESLQPFGVNVVKSFYQDYIINNNDKHDLIHIDIIHTYEDTFDLGQWAVNHSDCIIFHDTISYPEVMQAVTDLSKKYRLKFYNYEDSKGLGILIRET